MIRTVTGIIDGFSTRPQKMMSKEEIIKRHEEIIQNAKDGIYDNTVGYSSYVKYMEDVVGATRERIVVTEKHTRLVTLNNLDNGKIGCVINIQCPPGMMMSICGKEDVEDDKDAFALGLRLADTNNEEIYKYTKTKIDKIDIFDSIFNMYRIFYYDISMTNPDGPYRFKQSIILNGMNSLRISVMGIDNPCGDLICSEHNIISDNTKLSMDVDLWYL